jgi:hypothetical protein
MLSEAAESSLTGHYYRLTHRLAHHPLVAAGTDHRFDHDDEENPTSYLGDSVQTVMKEMEGGLSTRTGFAVQIRPGAYRLVTVDVQLQRVYDFTKLTTREALGPLAALVTDPGHPDALKTLGREARRAGIQGFIWESTQHPGGICLVVFLENVPDEDIKLSEDRILDARPV